MQKNSAIVNLSQTYQQPLDILINAGEQIYFKVTGAYDIHLTGNFVIPENEIMDSDDEESDDEEEMGDYSLDELLAGNEGDFSGDELDDLEDPRVMEVDSEEEAPKLVKSKKEEKKNKKRAADDSDEEISKDAIKKLLKTEDPTENGEKLTKKQKKKLKNNAGEATEAPKAESKPADKKAAKEVKGEKDAASANGSGKQVKFADKLEQGPTPTKADNDKGPKAWTVSGVKIDQRKAGSGPGAKKGDKVGMRYIGKLKDGKQFDGKLSFFASSFHHSTNTPLQPTPRASLSSSSSVTAMSSRAGTSVSRACVSVLSDASLCQHNTPTEARSCPASHQTRSSPSTSSSSR